MKYSTKIYVLISLTCALCLHISTAEVFAVPTFTDQAASILGGANVSGRSASLADIDSDGDLDLFFQGGTGARQLFRNNVIGTGAFNFTNVTSSMLPSGLGDSWSAAWGDYNGDGKIDVFVGQTNSGTAGDLLRNNGGTSFTNMSSTNGVLNDPGFHQNIAWADIDNDHDLDLIFGMEGPEQHEIYLQGPAGSFTPVGAAVGIQVPFGTKGYGLAIGDSDGDGDLDMYLSTCRGGGNIRKNFFKNMLMESGSLSFIDIADTNGTQTLANGYGTEFQDFDNDGDLDLYMVGADAQPTKIWRNNGGNMFTDVDTITGHPLLSDVAGDLNGGRAVDYDNDGDLDLYFHNNAAGDKARKLYRNDGAWQFTDVTVAEGIHAGIEGGYDSAWGDIDLDGDQDIIVPNNLGSAPNLLPERVFVSNASTNGNHWLYLRLAGTTDNTTAIGASVYATLHDGTPQELTLRREANTNAGTFNQSDLPVHFGLGTATLIDDLKIVWPNGLVQHIYNVAVDQYLKVKISALPGDFNNNGVVDAADYTVWRDHLGQTFALPNESLTPGVVTQEDFNEWKSHFGQTLAGSGAGSSLSNASVPEPASLVLVLVVVAPALLTRCARVR